ncbi:hypothetical protein JBL43_18935 [Aureibaculum sp. A20]|uniref:Uncharacterized protein n=1 Tax=Aureibaculum flavum TaxID=2795986 RepID=A0ABS0WWP7_9FLAO|nr:hypothetical protein [Aureibaculum flavum]MBJ2176335.1 hypothetical protein [Aureibaculum flavum]
MKKSLKILGVLLALYLTYSNIGPVRYLVDRVSLFGLYADYNYLSDHTVTSESYQINKIIDGNLDGPITYNTATQEYILTIYDSDYDRNNAGWKTLWKVNKDGKVGDSLNFRDYINKLGYNFEKDYYMDWIYSGNKAKQEYHQIINYDSIEANVFHEYIAKSDIIIYGNDYDDDYINCYVNINDNWIVFKSAKGFDDFYMNPFKFYKQEEKSLDSLIVLANKIAPWQKWKDKNEPIYLEKFVGKSPEHSSFFDINNTSRSGWNGTGYFSLTHFDEILNFKAYTFKSGTFGSYFPDIELFYPKKEFENPKKIAFIELRGNGRSKRAYKENGIYILKSKE